MKYWLLFISSSIIIINYSFAQINKYLGGTTIITVITKDSIIIASDSKLSYLYNSSISDTVYKIGIREKIAYAIAGEFVIIKDDSNKLLYNAYYLIDSLLLTYRNIDSTILHFINISLSTLNKILGNETVDEVNRFSKAFKNRVMEIQLVTFEKDTVKYRFREIGFSYKQKLLIFLDKIKMGMDSTTYDWPLISTSTTDIINKSPSFHFMGLYDSINVDNKSYKFNLNKIIQDLKNMIKKEMVVYPSLIGEPIRILVIYPHKEPKWYD